MDEERPRSSYITLFCFVLFFQALGIVIHIKCGVVESTVIILLLFCLLWLDCYHHFVIFDLVLWAQKDILAVFGV